MSTPCPYRRFRTKFDNNYTDREYNDLNCFRYPCSTIFLWKNVIVAGFGNSQIKLFAADTGKLAAQVNAHARWVTALDVATENGMVSVFCFVDNVDSSRCSHREWNGKCSLFFLISVIFPFIHNACSVFHFYMVLVCSYCLQGKIHSSEFGN